MRKLTVQKPWILAFLFVLALAGCGREQTRATLPTVIANSPVNGATAVLLNTTVSATFSSMMNPATINTTSFLLTGPGGTAVSGTVSYSGTTAVFMPSASLAANSVYNAVITTAAQDPAGNAIAANYQWTFTTGAPTVISTVPANG